MRTPPRFDHPRDLRALERYRIVGLVCMVVLILAFPFYRAAEPNRLEAAKTSMRQENIELGRELYALHCASCHGPEGRGGQAAPTLAAKEFLSSVTDQQMHWLIAAGGPGTAMSAYDIDFGGPLTDQEIERIVTFLRSFEERAPSVPGWRAGAPAPASAFEPSDDAAPDGQPKAPVPADDTDQAAEATDDASLAHVRQTYLSYCAACHGPSGAGTQVAGVVRPPSAPLDQDLQALQKVISQGVSGTAMVAFGSAHGGPLDAGTIEKLARWLQAGAAADD